MEAAAGSSGQHGGQQQAAGGTGGACDGGEAAQRRPRVLLAATGSVATIKLVQLAELLLQVRLAGLTCCACCACYAHTSCGPQPGGACSVHAARRLRLLSHLRPPGHPCCLSCRLLCRLCFAATTAEPHPAPHSSHQSITALQFADVRVIATKSAQYFFQEGDLPPACRPLLGACTCARGGGWVWGGCTAAATARGAADGW